MARSQKELYDEYKKRGGKKTFKAFNASASAIAKQKATPAKSTAKVNKAKKMVSGKLEKNLRKPIKRKYSI